MEVNRRDIFKMGAAAGAAALLSGCNRLLAPVESDPSAQKLPEPGNVRPELRLLNRMAFGPTAADLNSIETLGREGYIDQQLKAELSNSLGMNVRLSQLDVVQLEPSDLLDLPREEVIRQLQQAGILRAVYSKNQLQERMVDFWSNHFNIYSRKGDTAFAKGMQENDAIRKHALGKFPAMLDAVAHSPAMLEYLDNSENAKGVPNENYARELMELHTLGLGGGYTQRDIQEVARCFTGWTIETRFLRPQGHFRFDESVHDDGEKVVLGQRIPAGGGEKDALTVLHLLVTHPSTARFISKKLCRYFLGEEPPHWIEELSKTYRKTGGDLPQMIRPLLLSKDLDESPPILKRPFDYLVSSMRVAGAQTDAGEAVQKHLATMGEPLYEWPMPDGYPDKTAAWSGTMLPRWNFAFALAAGQIGGTEKPKLKAPQISVLANAPVLSSDNDLASALCLASPDFQWR